MFRRSVRKCGPRFVRNKIKRPKFFASDVEVLYNMQRISPFWIATSQEIVRGKIFKFWEKSGNFIWK